MKIIIYSLLFAFPALLAFSGGNELQEERERASGAYRRLMEAAHPTPDKKKYKSEPQLLEAPAPLPYFLDVSATVNEGTDPNKMQNESSIAVNFTNPKNLIASAVDYRGESSTWVYVSDDGGASWINLNLGKPFSGWRSTNDPSVAFDKDGTGYLVYGGMGAIAVENGLLTGENGVFMARTTDEGKNWKAHMQVIVHQGQQSLDSNFEDKYYIQVDNSENSTYRHDLYIPWKRVTPRDSATQIVISKSTDRGESWSSPIGISPRLSGTSEDTTYGQSFPLATTGPNGEVYVVWNDGIEHAVGFAKSLDGGKTYSAPRLIQRYNIFGVTRLLEGQGWRHSLKVKVRAEAYPVVLADVSASPTRGNLYLTWAADNIPNIYFSKSTDKGETWSAPKIVHSDTTNDQFWQWLAQDPISGDLAIMYLDSRNDTENLLTECYVSYSSDGGETWIDKPASAAWSDLRRNPFQGNSFAGDYSGCAFYDGIVYPSWVDMRNTFENITDSDVFTAIVNTRLPEPPLAFKSVIDPNAPGQLKLQWLDPVNTVFNKPMIADSVKMLLYRDSVLIAQLPIGAKNYLDTGLAHYSKHFYAIKAEYKGYQSMERTLVGYPGGAKEPMAPVLTGVASDDRVNYTVGAKLPAMRADSVTPLSNLASIDYYLDGKKSFTKELNSTDTNSTLNQTIEFPGQGWYRVEAVAVDAEGNESARSNALETYVGPFDFSYSDNVEENLPKYLVKGGWEATNEIAFDGAMSYSNAPKKSYENGQRDTLTLYPVASVEGSLTVEFAHIAEIAKGDSAYVEWGYYGDNKWNKISDESGKPIIFNAATKASWGDKKLTADDWKQEKFSVNLTNHEPVVVRFIFRANAVINSLGWYLDDIEINGAVSVSERAIEASKVFPNPANVSVNVKFEKEIPPGARFELMNSMGELVYAPYEIGAERTVVTASIASLPEGVYFFKLIGGGETAFGKFIKIGE
ncbi:MAG: T9SS type A sorting domain-containing protein [Chloroflexota bacterium]